MHKKKYSNAAIGIRNPYPAIEKEGKLSFGGNQSWLPQPYLQNVGCGLIACTNLLLYMDRYEIVCEEKEIDIYQKKKARIRWRNITVMQKILIKNIFPLFPGME